MKNALRLKPQVVIFLIATALTAAAQRSSLQIDPGRSTVEFTLDAALHAVHGTFHVKPSTLQFDPSSGQVSGEIAVDAKSGETGNSMRDRKMHRDVLESDRYPEISFRPDRVEGAVKKSGKSSLGVHGTFRLHDVNREITVPAEIEISGDRWTAMAHFTIPYQKWGLKNPSTLFLRVSESVQVELVAVGTVAQESASVP